jgi:hypothetical protein
VIFKLVFKFSFKSVNVFSNVNISELKKLPYKSSNKDIKHKNITICNVDFSSYKKIFCFLKFKIIYLMGT